MMFTRGDRLVHLSLATVSVVALLSLWRFQTTSHSQVSSWHQSSLKPRVNNWDLVFAQQLKLQQAIEGKRTQVAFSQLPMQTNLCGVNRGTNLTLLALVTSAVGNFEARSAIRDTWAQVLRDSGALVYFLASQTTNKEIQLRVELENLLYHDIIQLDIIDHYQNLTLKTLGMVRLVAEQCENVRFVLKIDDDMMLNAARLVDYVSQDHPSYPVVIGRVLDGLIPFRNPTDKWYLPVEQFPGDTLPEFASGPAYILTGNAAPILLKASETYPPITLEDVYIGILVSKTQVRLVHHPEMFNRAVKLNGCTFPRVLTSHRFEPHQIRKMWHLVHTMPCNTESHLFLLLILAILLGCLVFNLTTSAIGNHRHIKIEP